MGCVRSLGNVVHQLARRHLLISGVAPFSALSARVRFFHIVHHLKCLLSLFDVSADDLAGHNIPQGPDWRRLTILFAWYLAGIPTAYVMHDSCVVGAPGIWARAIRVFIEGLVAFGLGGLIYVRHLFFVGCRFGANINALSLRICFAGTRALPVPSPSIPSDTAAVSGGKSVFGPRRPKVR